MGDRVAIITGGANGIGKACARRLAEDGCHVVIADVDARAGQALAEELGADKDRALFVSCNVADRLAVNNLLSETRSTFERLDVLVNNAGIVASGDILTLSESDFDKVMGVNLRGAFLVAREAARQMVDQIEEDGERTEDVRRRYSIINMSSVNGVMAIPDQLAYCATKGAINQMTKSMALALAKYGIRVNAIGPGSINTDVLKAVNDNPEAMDKIMSRTPLQRIGDPDEIASVASFLASKDASYITGTTIYADGGRLAMNYTVPKG
ncbi:dehydrogenase [Maricaulis sp. W15]|uniref:NAD(P)-dependent dehydrogenase (Short-subunit alcohol dehydrogenase family) n=1 Tax=Maricaulis maris TaxID=74318 RepID=A0A495DL38_9PROT|nr:MULTISPECIES: SDR family NAD(P)-dependent oxidoreductase [Maricaulis]OLF81214.1 dehydrogenase [Maricaulis sp. W15]RKR03646.1 NAD(P)-dependent dehydrogenase (short-subunit alcohol dehydrogenase family) [Maricaulis maris]